MDSCHSPNLFPTVNRSQLWIIRGLFAFRDAYEPIHGYLCLPICAFGVFTNIVHILVLTSRDMRSSAVNIILSAIAICDAGTMLSYLIYLIHFVLSPQDYCSNGGSFLSWSWMLFLMTHISVSIALHTCSLWLVVAMAFVRLMALRQRTLFSKWQKSEIAWKISTLTTATVLILCVPTIASHEIRRGAWHSMCRTNVSRSAYMNDSSYGVYTIGISQLAQKDGCGLYKANLWLTGIVFKVIPSCLLILLSIGLLIRISAAEKNRRRLLKSSGDREARKRMKSLIASYGTSIQRIHLRTFMGPPPSKQQQENELLDCHRAGRKKSRCRSSSSPTDHTTIMLITILFVFLLAEVPQGVIAILNAVFLRDVTMYVYQSLDDFMDLLSLVNACVNFILYCVMSSRYRQTFWRVVLPRQAYVKLFLRGGGGKRQKSSSKGRVIRNILLGSDKAATACPIIVAENDRGGRTINVNKTAIVQIVGGSPPAVLYDREHCSIRGSSLHSSFGDNSSLLVNDRVCTLQQISLQRCSRI